MEWLRSLFASSRSRGSDDSKIKPAKSSLYETEEKDGNVRYIVNEAVLKRAADKAAAVGSEQIDELRKATAA